MARGPREALVSRIETCVDSLLWRGVAAIDDLLRARNVPPPVGG